ncbi:YncE family protein [Alkaliphilus pronyensis]|uniref:YncE family protein n=1 Tax=Alkaliphilus pronyensis TaxID=1482732 RepID=A0A6I0FCA8_9FIRM|nr:YncE family protein [Alkaliphilus pronyensis]KAB3535380.1 YncE family protein [Alkaliphilus pronyensis]
MNDLSLGNLIVANFFDDSISIVDPIKGKEQRRISLNQYGKVYPLERLGPHHIAVDRCLKYLYVPNNFNNSLKIIDLITGAPKEILYVGSCPSQVILCRKYNYIYVANSDSNSVTAIHLDTLKVALQIPTGEHPHGMVMTTDQERIFVANQGSGTITEITTKNNEKKKCHSLDGNPWHLKLSYNGKHLYAVHYSHLYERKGKIFIFDVDEMKLIKTINIGKMPVEVVADKNNQTLYISDSDMDILHIYSLEKDREEGRIKLGKMPHGVEINYDKDEVYVTSIHENLLHVIDTVSKRIVKSISVGKEPTSILVL